MKKSLFLMIGFVGVSLFMNAQEVKPKQDHIEIYDASGKFNKQIPFDYYDNIKEMASFPGGQEALTSFITKNLIYPPSAIENKIEGNVVMRFIVSPTGNMMNIQTVKAPDGGNILIKEAQRLLMRMPKWIPGKLNDKNVYTEIILPITFKLTK